MGKIKLIELFAGIGTQTQALKNIGVDHEVVGISEIDKFALTSYKILHGDVKNFGDISKIEALPFADIWTYSFPCTDISIAGQQKGFAKDSGTRSGLLWEVMRLLEKAKQNNTLPRILLLENVKNIVSPKFKPLFEDFLEELKNFGYVTKYKVLNAKDFGIPQNRERVFAISILGENNFEFPEPQKLELCLKDILEKNVDKKYYLKTTPIICVYNTKFKQKVKFVHFGKNIFGKLFLKNIKKSKIVVAGKLNGGIWDRQFNQHRKVLFVNGISPTLTTSAGGGTKIKVVAQNTIRNLTPKEYWRLMGWQDDLIDKVIAGKISNTQMYKQAGNGIVVNVLEAIFFNLFKR